ncbi:MAG: type II toxin-antitoxin system VapC family toxin [Opitutaceae bacterium]
MLTHLLDTSVYSQRLRPNPLESVVDRWRRLGDSALAVSGICEAELRYGLAKKDSNRLWSEYREFLENRLVLLPVDKAVADAFGEIKAVMEREGQPRPDFDLLIAATARAHRLILATLNARHFVGIPGLQVEDWARA